MKKLFTLMLIGIYSQSFCMDGSNNPDKTRANSMEWRLLPEVGLVRPVELPFVRVVGATVGQEMRQIRLKPVIVAQESLAQPRVCVALSPHYAVHRVVESRAAPRASLSEAGTQTDPNNALEDRPDLLDLSGFVPEGVNKLNQRAIDALLSNGYRANSDVELCFKIMGVSWDLAELDAAHKSIISAAKEYAELMIENVIGDDGGASTDVYKLGVKCFLLHKLKSKMQRYQQVMDSMKTTIETIAQHDKFIDLLKPLFSLNDEDQSMSFSDIVGATKEPSNDKHNHSFFFLSEEDATIEDIRHKDECIELVKALFSLIDEDQSMSFSDIVGATKEPSSDMAEDLFH